MCFLLEGEKFQCFEGWGLVEDSHAEVGDEGRFGQVHLKEYFLRGVGFVQSIGGHDCVSEPRCHRRVYCDTEHLHHLNRVGKKTNQMRLLDMPLALEMFLFWEILTDIKQQHKVDL